MPDPKDPTGDPKDPKDPKDPSGDPKDPKDPKGDPSPEDVIALKKIISDKDTKLTDALTKLGEFEKAKKEGKGNKNDDDTIIELRDLVKSMSEELTIIRKDKERTDLAKKYPDIVPDILVGKDEKEQETIVAAQRKLSEHLYGDSAKFHQPTYENEDEVEKDIDAVKKDEKISGENAARKVLNLIREKSRFKK